MYLIRLTLSSTITALLVLLTDMPASAGGRVWHDHANPYTVLTGTHIDTHLEVRLMNSGNLKGFLYVTWRDSNDDGVTDIDPVSGLPEAEHCTKQEHYDAGCFAGWTVEAEPCIREYNECTAAVLYHNDDHPVWLIGAADEPRDNIVDTSDGSIKGSRIPIPQPRVYNDHYHWLTEGASREGDDGTTHFPSVLNPDYPEPLPDLPAIDSPLEEVLGVAIDVPDDCNVAMAKPLADNNPGLICPGYFMQIKAIETFAFHHGGESIPVRPGQDLETHHNTITSYVPVFVGQ
jgi:hypothetical protein